MRNSTLKQHLQYHGRGKIVTVKDSQARSSCSTKTDVFISTSRAKGFPFKSPAASRCSLPNASQCQIKICQCSPFLLLNIRCWKGNK